MQPDEKRVLLIDDELELWQETLSDELGKYGFVLDAEENPANTFEKIQSFKPDVLLLDIHFFGSDYSGLDLLRQIREKEGLHDLPVMMLTTTLKQTDYDPVPYENLDAESYAKELLNRRKEYEDLAKRLCKLIDKKSQIENLIRAALEKEEHSFIVGKTSSMKRLISQLEQVAKQDASIVIVGESGTGKELLARAIYRHSARKDKPFAGINCGALPEQLAESELFGHEKGAFTGAATRKEGHIEIAHGGTVFLDEIGNMPLAIQVKLLRFLQERRFFRLGGTKEIESDVRIIAATNQSLTNLIKQGLFREDLYFRLKVMEFHLPPLRERREDIEELYKHYINKYSKDFDKIIIPEPRDDVLEKLRSYSWPGNMREFANVIYRAMMLTSHSGYLQMTDFDFTTEVLPHHSDEQLIDQVIEFMSRSDEKQGRERLLKAIYKRARERCSTITEAANLIKCDDGTLGKALKKL